MDKTGLLTKLSKIERISRASRFRRLLYSPFKYIFAIFLKQLVYRITGRELTWRTGLFWRDKIFVALPASTDIFLLGCKTHSSELRLTRFILKNLGEGDFFVDVGAHIGFYSLLASLKVGQKGHVVAIEPSPASFELLKKNVLNRPGIKAINMALSDDEGMIDFFEFRGPYSEYNTMDPAQFEGQQWFNKNISSKISIMAMPGDRLLEDFTAKVTIIKIDVEGAENKVIKGFKDYLTKNSPFVVMEFLATRRNNTHHLEADHLLRSMGYTACRIDGDGELLILHDLANVFMDNSDLESENLVYVKQSRRPY